jgi:RNA polymerase sigma-54 factor
MSNISQRLDLRQSQNLVMTPQLQQAIKLLQLSNQELSEFVEEEIAQNPLLEKKEGEESAAPETAAEETKSDDKNDYEDDWTDNDSAEGQSDFDPGSANATIGAGGNKNFDTLDDAFENSISSEETLRDHLGEQLNMAFEDSKDRMIGGLLIDSLDEAGYLRSSVTELSERLGCSTDRIGRLLDTMKQFSPSGVFARDLQECLALQLEEQHKLDAPMKILLANLAMLADHNHVGLAKKCDVNETYLQDMVADIRALNPKPASNYDHTITQTVIPDVLMKKLPKHLGGGWRVELNADTLPKVLVNNEYYTEVAKTAVAKKDKEYLSSQLNNANWLIKALDQRAQTIIKVAGEIVEQQDAFFNFGIEFLRPLTLKDVAEVIDMHESTVSRVTNNKYIGTPRGIFELKYFFTTTIAGSNGSTHSAESVKARIKVLIDAEDASDVLSDDTIVDMLKSEGVELARRTVAKYREAMHIPSSVQRRKQKKNQAS